MKKFMSIAMTAIAGICLLSMVGCGKKLEVKMETPYGRIPPEDIKFYVNGDDWLPGGIHGVGQVTPRIKVTYIKDVEVYGGRKWITDVVFTVKGLKFGDEIHMEIRPNLDNMISQKVEVKNQKKVVFREWRQK